MKQNEKPLLKRYLEWLSWNLLSLSLAIGTFGWWLMGVQHLEMTWLMIPAAFCCLLAYTAAKEHARAWRAL